MSLEVLSFITSLFALLTAGFLAWQIKKRKLREESPGRLSEAEEIASSIHQGALTFLTKEYKILLGLVLVLTLILALSPIGWQISLAFLLGALFSGLAGFIGLFIATSANLPTAWLAQRSLSASLKTAFSSGAVMALSVVGLGLFGISSLYLIFRTPGLIYGFGFGASLVALFARVGGGIYTKAADVGADLVGKTELNIPEDDPRNPAVIADNVGDNVGDVAGMGADLFESYTETLIAAMVLGLGLSNFFASKAIVLPLGLAGLGILASIVGIFFIKWQKVKKPERALNSGIWLASFLMAFSSYFLIKSLFDTPHFFVALLIGLISGIIIGLVTEYYTSSKNKPAQAIAQASLTGAGTNIIAGLSLGFFSTLIPVVTISLAIYLAHLIAGLYGIALAGVGMLSTLGITLAADCYGPVADNAAGICEMAGLGEKARERTEKLDAVGNTTAAIGKGFAIGSAALTALVLLVSFSQVVGLREINLIEPKVLIGLFIGGLLPFIFSSFSMRAVGKAASRMVEEVRRQFKEIPGLKEGKAKSDYRKCIAISTEGALRQMIWPGLLALFSPLVIGFLLGKESLGGLLAGSLIAGFLLAITMANSGGAWDNAKKFIEAGNLGGKGSPSHKASVVGDTVGDPFKDTSGPSLNILLKLMAIVSLIIAPLL
jgi:K(+)-stimulated pyrophosphate-energized sodium pump